MAFKNLFETRKNCFLFLQLRFRIRLVAQSCGRTAEAGASLRAAAGRTDRLTGFNSEIRIRIWNPVRQTATQRGPASSHQHARQQAGHRPHKLTWKLALCFTWKTHQLFTLYFQYSCELILYYLWFIEPAVYVPEAEDLRDEVKLVQGISPNIRINFFLLILPYIVSLNQDWYKYRVWWWWWWLW